MHLNEMQTNLEHPMGHQARLPSSLDLHWMILIILVLHKNNISKPEDSGYIAGFSLRPSCRSWPFTFIPLLSIPVPSMYPAVTGPAI